MDKNYSLIKVSDAAYVDRYKIKLRFTDGLEGVVDLENELWGEVFEPVNDVDYFRQFKRDRWTIGWDCGADFAPEFLHDLLLKQHS